MPRFWRRLAREPLLHFVLAGSALFALERAFGNASEPPTTARRTDDSPIVVDQTVRTELAAGFQSSNGRAPNDAELENLIARWIDRQILYREGLARGLERDDPRIVQRVADKMAFVMRTQIVPPEPTEAELELWFREHADRYRQHAAFDFVQVFVEGHDAAAEKRAAELLEKLEGGADPGGLGDTFSGGRRYRGRKLADLAERFGDEFAAGIAEQDKGRWALRRSRFGLHLVRVEERTTAREGDYASARDAVRTDWLDAKREEGMARAMDELRARRRIVRE